MKYKLKTSVGCTTDGGFKPIAGYQKDVDAYHECEAECDKYDWCKGYRIKRTNTISCRLLTDKKDAEMEGWILFNKDNWVEPEQWIPTEYPSDGPGYKCFVKNGNTLTSNFLSH